MTAVNTPPVVSRREWLTAIDTLRAREKAHTREGDAIAAARRRLPMTEVDPSTPLVTGTGAVPLIDVFEGRTQLFVLSKTSTRGTSTRIPTTRRPNASRPTSPGSLSAGAT
ncbi:DUF899 family protein [Streptomyces sp. NPDC005727]|uniref:DUF899 family protein n=1 Tax=Streptomyces sp. NPDC005727 TaxID=3157053 RepID=UPI0033F5708D